MPLLERMDLGWKGRQRGFEALPGRNLEELVGIEQEDEIGVGCREDPTGEPRNDFRLPEFQLGIDFDPQWKPLR